jgi:predicted phosphodiesterase
MALPNRDEALRVLRSTGFNAAESARIFSVPARTFQQFVQREGLRSERPNLRLVPDELSQEPSFDHEIPVFHLDYSDYDHLYVYPLGDVHLGSRMHDAKRWGEWLRWLQTADNVSMIGTGDFFNSAIVGSKSDIYEEQMTVGHAKRLFREQLYGINVDLLVRGNHEDRVFRSVGDDPVQDVADFHGFNYSPTAALLVYKVGGYEYEVFVRHGTGNGQALAGLSKSAMTITADVYITGHTHKQAATADEYFTRRGSQLVRKRRYYVSSGSFLAYEGYAAARGYTPTRLGAPRLLLNGERHDVHVSI